MAVPIAHRLCDLTVSLAVDVRSACKGSHIFNFAKCVGKVRCCDAVLDSKIVRWAVECTFAINSGETVRLGGASRLPGKLGSGGLCCF
jgi:hypothetical protein